LNTEGITAVSIHPHLMWVAVAFTSRSKTHITLFDIAANASIDLTHAFMSDGIVAMMWKPQSHATLLVGIKGGVMVWGASDWTNCRCIVYPCSQTVTSLALGGDDFCLLAAGGNDVHIEVHDISKPPSDSVLVVKRSYEGPTSTLAFSADCSMLLQGFCHYASVKVWDLNEMNACFSFSTDQPVLQIAQISSKRDVFAVSLDRTEGITVCFLRRNQLFVLAKISTSEDNIGGFVRSFSACSSRLFVLTESWKVLVFHVDINSAAFVAHYIGCFGVTEGTVIHSGDGCFPKGTFLAVGGKASVHFVPCYHDTHPAKMQN
jgi:WD40 repeat protein